MRKFGVRIIFSLFVGALTLDAQTTTALRGKVVDSTGLPMASTTIRVYEGAKGTKLVKQDQSSSTGDFNIDLPPAEYRVEVTAPDFATYAQTVRLTANMQPLSITMTLKEIELVMNVSADQNEISVDPDSSLTTDTITGDALLDLPDNEDDLLAYLTQLAAARGIIDGELNIKVDGFDNARLPNRSEIAEIRIINSSFSAESNTTGPRIEIVTRPGTGVWTGNAGMTFADALFNAAAPLTGRKPASQTKNFNAGMRGPIIKNKITATLNITHNERDSEGNAIRAVGINGPVNSGVNALNKTRSITFGPNITLSKTNTIVGNFNYSDNVSDNSGVGGFTLPERATNQRGHNWNIQLTERATLGSKFTNELRFQARRGDSSTIPVTSGIAINVQDSFNGGGAPNRNSNSTRDYTLANLFRWQTTRKLQLTGAVQADHHRIHSDSENNYLGTYTFSSLQDYCYAEGFIGTNCQDTQAIVEAAVALGQIPTFLNSAGFPIPITGIPTQFSITAGNPLIDVDQTEVSAYLQGEWRANPRMQVSFGARYQIQQHLRDFNNLAPTGGVAYQLNTNQKWKTVIRAGGRLTYSTFAMSNWEQLLRNDGLNHQFNTILLSPSYPNPDLSSLGAAQGVANSFRVRSADFVAPYSIQPSATWEQSLPRGNSINVNFQVSRSVHQSRTRNINAPYPGTPLPENLIAQLNSRVPDIRNEARTLIDQLRPYFPLVSNITEQESNGKALTKNVSIQYRLANKTILWKKVQIGGNVTWAMNWAMDDNATPMNSYDLAEEWGRSSQDQRHRISSNLNVRMPWATQFTINPGWSSGRPYNITTGSDDNGDTATNTDRPAGYARNSATGPSAFSTMTLRFTKTFTFKPRSPGSAPSQDYAEPQRGGGGLGGGGGFGGGQGGGQGGGGQRGQQQNRQIQFTLSVNNLFNSTVRQGIVGVQSSPLFGQPTGGGQGRAITFGLTTSLGKLF